MKKFLIQSTSSIFVAVVSAYASASIQHHFVNKAAGTVTATDIEDNHGPVSSTGGLGGGILTFLAIGRKLR